MKRRDFVKTAIAGSAIACTNSLFAAEKKSQKQPDLVAIHGGSAVQMFEKGIAEMGGMSRFVKKGQTVVLKPNIAWDRTPDFGANTDPDLVAAVVKACLAAGAKKFSASTTPATPQTTATSTRELPKQLKKREAKWFRATPTPCSSTRIFQEAFL